MNKHILSYELENKKDGWYQNREVWKALNDITKNYLIGKSEVLFHNIKDCSIFPEVLKFVAFDWENIKLLVYREPEVKIIQFEDYNTCLDLIKKSETKLLSEGLEIDERDEKYKRIFLFKDLAKHKITELKKGEKIIKVGDFLNTNWGYDQTNIEIFVIKKIIGKNYLIIQEVSKSVRRAGLTSDMVKVADTLEKVDLPIKAYISNDGYMSICESGYKRSLSLTDMKTEHYETAEGFGH